LLDDDDINDEDRYDVFISFRVRESLAETRILRDALANVGVRAYVCEEQLEVGQDWATEIFGALESCDVFVVMGTPTYGSKGMEIMATWEELSYALRYNKFMYIVKLFNGRYTQVRARGLLDNKQFKFWDSSDPTLKNIVPEGCVDDIVRQLAKIRLRSGVGRRPAEKTLVQTSQTASPAATLATPATPATSATPATPATPSTSATPATLQPSPSSVVHTSSGDAGATLLPPSSPTAYTRAASEAAPPGTASTCKPKNTTIPTLPPALPAPPTVLLPPTKAREFNGEIAIQLASMWFKHTKKERAAERGQNLNMVFVLCGTLFASICAFRLLEK
jgi:hypothetical protein